MSPPNPAIPEERRGAAGGAGVASPADTAGGEGSPSLVLHVRPKPPLRVLCLGGGTGLPVVLKGLARHARPRPEDGWGGLQLTAVVTMSDDGGSSGRLRRSRGALPPGDIRNCLVALAPPKSPWSELFQFRFDGKAHASNGSDLSGHAIGNLLLTALAEQQGDFLKGLRLAERLLKTRGTVLPCTVDPVELEVEFHDGSRLVGQRKLRQLSGSGQVVKRVALQPVQPSAPRAAPGLLDAIASADLITLGPGSIYSSVLPNLLVEGVAEALHRARATKVLIGNLMTEPGEAPDVSCEEEVEALQRHVGRVFNQVLVSSTVPSEKTQRRYAKEGSKPAAWNAQALRALGVEPIAADLVRSGRKVRHDSRKLAACLLSLARVGA